MKIVRNVLTLWRQPTMAAEFLRFLFSSALHGGQAARFFPEDGFEVGSLSGFSEYRSCAEFISGSERRFLREYPFGEGTILDVGGNLGVFSLALARRFPERDLHAFEPNPTTYAAMRANFVRNGCGRAHAHHTAVAAHDGQVSFQVDPVHRATTHIASAEDRVAGSVSLMPVPCTTLDNFVAREGIGDIALLKVDVEGYEELVFRGAERLLASGRAKVIYYEVCPALTRQAGFDPEAVGHRLLAHGYRLHVIAGAGEVRPTQPERTSEVTLENWVALHD